jgi:hypothetical protein
MAEAWDTAKPDWLIWIATRDGVLDDCALRKFACWSVRQIWHLLTDERSRSAVEVAERFADGLATFDELAAARAAARDAAWAAAREAEWAAARDAAWAAAGEAAREAAGAAAGAAQAAWLRAAYPNPFSNRPLPLTTKRGTKMIKYIVSGERFNSSIEMLGIIEAKNRPAAIIAARKRWGWGWNNAYCNYDIVAYSRAGRQHQDDAELADDNNQ